MLYCCYDFNICFFKIFVSHILGGKFGFIIWSFTKGLKFCVGVHCYMLIKFCHPHNFGQSCYQNSNVNLIQGHIVIYWLCDLICDFSKYLHFISFWGKFHPKICFLPNLLKFCREIRKTRWKETFLWYFEQENYYSTYNINNVRKC